MLYGGAVSWGTEVTALSTTAAELYASCKAARAAYFPADCWRNYRGLRAHLVSLTRQHCSSWATTRQHLHYWKNADTPRQPNTAKSIDLRVRQCFEGQTMRVCRLKRTGQIALSRHSHGLLLNCAWQGRDCTGFVRLVINKDDTHSGLARKGTHPMLVDACFNPSPNVNSCVRSILSLCTFLFILFL